jgi:hypothetical protein
MYAIIGKWCLPDLRHHTTDAGAYSALIFVDTDSTLPPRWFNNVLHSYNFNTSVAKLYHNLLCTSICCTVYGAMMSRYYSWYLSYNKCFQLFCTVAFTTSTTNSMRIPTITNRLNACIWFPTIHPIAEDIRNLYAECRNLSLFFLSGFNEDSTGAITI